MAATDEQALEALAKKLHPDTIRSNLVRAGLYLAGWEMLKSEMQNKVREFYTVDVGGPYSARRYAEKVLALDSGKEKGKIFRASLLWLVETAALTEAQAERIRQMLDHRNEIAHEMPKVLVDDGHAGVDVALLREMRDIIAALGVFWGRIEIDTDPDFVGRDVADEDIRSGVSLFMDHLVAAAEEVATAAPASR